MTEAKFKTIRFTKFGQTKMVRAELYNTDEEFDEALWVERGEDLYALMSNDMRGKRIAVISREDWLRAKPIEDASDPLDEKPKPGTCGSCRFWHKILVYRMGECRRNSPVSIKPISVGCRDHAWPTTELDEWCGEWAPRIASNVEFNVTGITEDKKCQTE